MYIDVKMHFIKKIYKLQHQHYSTVFVFYELCFNNSNSPKIKDCIVIPILKRVYFR